MIIQYIDLILALPLAGTTSLPYQLNLLPYSKSTKSFYVINPLGNAQLCGVKKVMMGISQRNLRR